MRKLLFHIIYIMCAKKEQKYEYAVTVNPSGETLHQITQFHIYLLQAGSGYINKSPNIYRSQVSVL